MNKQNKMLSVKQREFFRKRVEILIPQMIINVFIEEITWKICRKVTYN